MGNTPRFKISYYYHVIISAFLLTALFIAYSNSFSAAWHLDDISSIVYNPSIHIQDLTPNSLYKTFFADPIKTGKLSRPLPYLSFAVNWYIGQFNPFGYHSFNFFLHVLSAVTLYQTILLLFQTPSMKEKYSSYAQHFIALLGSALWALHPIQTQAVTYIVQRMALMVGFFSVLGFYCYIRFRLQKSHKKSLLWIFGCIFSFIGAIGSKENAALFPLDILLIECIFFQDFSKSYVRKRILWIGSAILGMSIAFGFFLFLDPAFLLKFNEPGIRYFTPIERMMTQPRVLLLYISQLFAPHPSRFSFEHDFVISQSFLDPWTTIPSMLIAFGLIIFGILQAKKLRLVSFAILFFFLNHSIESSFIQLELIFEHRNYLPSMFLFVPFACGFWILIENCYKKPLAIRWVTALVAVPVIVFLAWGTYTRNKVYQTKKTLLLDSIKKAPGQARPLAIMAIDMARSKESTIETQHHAYRLLQQAQHLSKPRKEVEADIIGNMAFLHHLWGDYGKAIQLYEKALAISPNTDSIRIDMINTLIALGKWERTLQQINIVVSKNEDHPVYLHKKGILLLWMNRPEHALRILQKSLRVDPNQPNIHFSIGIALSNLKKNMNANWFFKRALNKNPQNALPVLALLDLNLKNHAMDKAKQYAQFLFSHYTVPELINTLKNLPQNFDAAPIPVDRIQEYIGQELTNKTNRFTT